MKKRLNILGTITLVGTVITNIIACDNNSNNDIKYEINDNGEIIYNFQVKQAYIIEFTINSHIYESNIYVTHPPLQTFLSWKWEEKITFIY